MSLIPIDEVVLVEVTLHHPTTGAVTDGDSVPTYDVFEEATDTPILAAQTMTKRTSLTGNYRGQFTASAANGVESGKWYSVIVTAVVNSITAKHVEKTFRAAPAESAAGVPKADTSHFGGAAGTFASGRPEVNTSHAAGTAWGSGAITAASIAADAITDAKVASDVTIASVTGAVGSVTGAVGSVTGAVGSVGAGGITAASLASDTITAAKVAADVTTEIQAGLATAAALSSVASDVTTLLGRITSGLFTGITSMAQWLGLIAGKQAGNATARTEVRATGAGSGTFDEATDALEAVRDNMGTAQTGDAYTRLGAPSGASVSADVAAVKVDTAAVKLKTDNLPSDPADQSLIIAATDAVMTRLGAPAGASVSADIAAIEAQTDDIGVAGAGLTAVPWNAAWDAEVQSEAADALNAYDPPTKAELDAAVAPLATQVSVDTLDNFVDTEVTAIKGVTDKIDTAVELDGAVYRFTVNALEQAPTGGSAPTAAAIADAVWEEAIADHSGVSGSTAEQLATAGAAGDPWATAVPGAYGAGTAGKILGDNVNAAISSRASQTSVDDLPTNAELSTALGTADDAVLAAVAALNNLSQANIRTAVGLASANLDTQLADLPTNAELATALATADDAVLAAIAALNNLSQANVRTAVGLASANLDTQLTAIDDSVDTEIASIISTLATVLAAIDTEVAAIKAKTDLLPASPAATGGAMTLTTGERTSVADAVLTRDFAAITGEAARSMINALRFSRNKFTIIGGILSVKKEDDTTEAWSGVVTQTVGDPVSAIDPA